MPEGTVDCFFGVFVWMGYSGSSLSLSPFAPLPLSLFSAASSCSSSLRFFHLFTSSSVQLLLYFHFLLTLTHPSTFFTDPKPHLYLLMIRHLRWLVGQLLCSAVLLLGVWAFAKEYGDWVRGGVKNMGEEWSELEEFPWSVAIEIGSSASYLVYSICTVFGYACVADRNLLCPALALKSLMSK